MMIRPLLAAFGHKVSIAVFSAILTWPLLAAAWPVQSGQHTSHGALPPPPSPIIAVTPAAPTIPGSTPSGGVVASYAVTLSNFQPYTGPVPVFGPPFSSAGNTFALTGTNTAGNIIVNPAGPGVGSITQTTIDQISILATQGTITTTQNVNITIVPAPAVPVITVVPAAPTIPSTTMLGATIATYAVAMSDGSAFVGTTVFGPPNNNDNGTFALSGTSTGGNIIVSPTGPGVGGGAGNVTDLITLVATTTPGSNPAVTVSNLTPAANSTVTVTYSPGSNTAGANDVLQMFYVGGGEYNCNGDGAVHETTSFPSGFMTVPKGPGSVNVKIPNVASVEPQSYVIGYLLGGAFQCPPVAQSAVITVPPTLPPFQYASSNIPSDVTAYPSNAVGVANWPNPPNRVLTVCTAGPPTCQYSTLSAAVFDAGFTNPVDFTQIKVDCGTYSYDNQSGDWRSNIPLHLWIYGHCASGALPHFFQDPASNPPVNGFFSFIDQSYSIFELIVDNIEISNWQHGGASSPAVSPADCNGDANQWVTLFRNVYIHDAGQGIFKGVGECSWNFTMLNSHIARTGGTTGPAHGIYVSNVVQAGNPTPVNFTAKRSVFEENYLGHLVKSHATSDTFDCDVFIKDYSEVYGGAKEIETEQGGYVEQITNSLFVQGPWWWDNTQSNFFGLGYAAENTGGYVAIPTMFMSMNNSIYINDLTGTQAANNGQQGIPVGQFQGFSLTNVPTAWNNNTFVGPYGNWGPTGGTAMIAPYINWCWDGGQQSNCNNPVGFGTPSPITGLWYVNNNLQVDLGCGAATNPGGPPPGNDYRCPQDAAANSRGNLFFSSRATAASHNWPSSGTPLGSLPNADGGTVVGWSGSGLDPTKFPLPAACTQPIGNVVAPPS